MIRRYNHTEAASAYIQLSLSACQGLERRLAQKIMSERGSLYSFLPNHVIVNNDLECLETDILQLTGEEQEEINLRDAEVIYRFLSSDPTAAFIVLDLDLQNRPEFPQLKIARLRSKYSAEKKTYAAVSLREGTVDTIQEFLTYVPTRQIISFLTYLPLGVVESLQPVEIEEDLANSMVTGCQHVVVGIFDYYARLFWSSSRSPSRSSQSLSTTDYTALSSPAKLEFDPLFFFYFQQQLCGTLWQPWVQPYAGSMREGGHFWCFAPISSDPFFGCKMGAPFRVAYPKAYELRLRESRKKLFVHLGAYLKDHPTAFMLTGGQYLYWSESEPLLPGRSADGAFRVVVDAHQKYRYNSEDRHRSHIFRAILAGPDAAQCIEQFWRPPFGISCCAIIDAPNDPFTFIREDRALTTEELEDKLRPLTSHVIIGGFRNDLPIVWSKVGIDA